MAVTVHVHGTSMGPTVCVKVFGWNAWGVNSSKANTVLQKHSGDLQFMPGPGLVMHMKHSSKRLSGKDLYWPFSYHVTSYNIKSDADFYGSKSNWSI